MVTRPTPRLLVRVDRLWPNSTIVCLACGPSLTQADVDQCQGQHVIAINDAYRLAGWAEVLYACDARWWDVHKGVPTFGGLKYTLQAPAARWPGVQPLRQTGRSGIETDPTGLRTGMNSGYQALNLAVHLGASRIVLLGYDMGHPAHKPSHFFGEHPRQLRTTPLAHYHTFLAHFSAAAPILRRLGVCVINCSRQTALACFPRQDLAQALQSQMAVAS